MVAQRREELAQQEIRSLKLDLTTPRQVAKHLGFPYNHFQDTDENNSPPQTPSEYTGHQQQTPMNNASNSRY
jgi:hypothetical protein